MPDKDVGKRTFLTARRITRSSPLIAVHRFFKKYMSKNGVTDGCDQSFKADIREAVFNAIAHKFYGALLSQKKLKMSLEKNIVQLSIIWNL